MAGDGAGDGDGLGAGLGAGAGAGLGETPGAGDGLGLGAGALGFPPQPHGLEPLGLLAWAGTVMATAAKRAIRVRFMVFLCCGVCIIVRAGGSGHPLIAGDWLAPEANRADGLA